MACYGQPFRLSYTPCLFSDTRSQMAKRAIQPIEAINTALLAAIAWASFRNEI
jgi:hypothetical protein